MSSPFGDAADSKLPHARDVAGSGETDGPTAKQGAELSSLLERVLSRTTDGAAAEAELTTLEWTALREVAQRYSGQSLELEPVGLALVRAILTTSFPQRMMAETTFEQMTAEIAATLFDDPWARKRLETLWARLTQSPQQLP